MKTEMWSPIAFVLAAMLALIPNVMCAASFAGDTAYQKAKSSFEAGNPSEAAKWLEEAVAQGHLAAQLPLAAMYRDGHGVEQDYERAVALFTDAAKYGYPSAQFSLGVMYRLGEGVERNYTKAIKWYRLAAMQGDAESQNSLGVMNESGRGTNINLSRAYMWYEIAAQNGSRRGKNNRQRLSQNLSAMELPKAKKLTQKCLGSNYRNCG